MNSCVSCPVLSDFLLFVLLLLFILPSDNVSYMIWSNINQISYSTPVFSLPYPSETAHIPLSLPEVSILQLLPLAYPRNTLLFDNAPPPRHW